MRNLSDSNISSVNTISKQQFSQICNQQMVILLTLFIYCKKGDQSYQTINTHITFQQLSYNFDGSVFFNVAAIHKVNFIGHIENNNKLNLFSFLSEGDINISSSVAQIVIPQSQYAALIQSQGNLQILDCQFSFESTAIALGGLLFQSMSLKLENCTYQFKISCSKGGMFSYSAINDMELNNFIAIGVFNTPQSYLVIVCNNLNIITQNVTTDFNVQYKCSQGNCNILCNNLPLNPICNMVTYQYIAPSFQKININSYGKIVTVKCAVPSNLDVNNSYIIFNLNTTSNNQMFSIFCTVVGPRNAFLNQEEE
ncbi:Hypothetical_protein [Hexamita inflata]|uniref:Hypothetical_protein n=1 Tax=Hexamita inflata TaxID=28002 RepID=A0AA86RKL4_9EUKA|nr:Hypothetical protein HINF_LOCUS64228 [Hexamita inflata]